jgi:hypothetical protein
MYPISNTYVKRKVRIFNEKFARFIPPYAVPATPPRRTHLPLPSLRHYLQQVFGAVRA